MKRILGIVGCGNMGGAIVSGALSSGIVESSDIVVYDVLQSARERARQWGVQVVADDREVSERSDVILLAVKPQQAQEAVEQCGTAIDGKALMSVVAGLRSAQLRSFARGKPRILRLLPNTPALVHQGAFALSSDSDFTEDELHWATALYQALGIVEFVPERLLDAVCGLSGGAPAYVAMFIEAMADGGVQQGLPRNTAYRLAAQTCLGTAQLIIERGLHPAEVKDMVTSPAGTTVEGCSVLERGAFRGVVIDAILAGAERARQL